MEMKRHWEWVYASKAPADVSWFQAEPGQSLALIGRCGLTMNAAILDVGAGASALPDGLLARGYSDITVLDISAAALNVAQKRLGEKAARIKWIVSDVLDAPLPEHHFDVWHDRAVFHFLTRAEDRARYVALMRASLKRGASIIMATFGPGGPLKCSGLDVVRYSAETLQKELGAGLVLEESFLEMHPTPFGTQQEFLFCRFTMTGDFQ